MLPELLLALALLGLAAYVVFGGADFGAGFWHLTARGPRREELREASLHALAPVWEANHVWLIFVLVVAWTAFPVAFASIVSTLTAPLFVAAIGIVLRGASYALRESAGEAPMRAGALGLIFSLSSILTPFALGAAVGAIAAGTVPVGNAAGDLLTSWTGPVSILIGTLSVAFSAYLAAVYLAADMARAGRTELAEAFRVRALVAGGAAGALAIAGLFVLAGAAPDLYGGLTSGLGLVAVLASAAAGIGTLALVVSRRYEVARFLAAAAVAATVAGWPLAQSPRFLPDLTVGEAAAEEPVLVALLIGLGAGFAVLIPSLALLFGLVLRGRFDEGYERPASGDGEGDGPATRLREQAAPRVLTGAVTLAGVAGALLLLLTEGGLGRIAGVALLLTFVFVAPALALRPERITEP
jgi:cytochrome d ubiquinol oxidase subunit II